MTPTIQQTEAFQISFDHYNQTLFDGALPQVVLTFNGRSKKAGGFFAPGRWENEEGKVHELSINPLQMKNFSPKFLASILVHEMAHLWQQEFGKPSRNGYHNKEWGQKMKELGLYPSNTGEEGGKETGQQMAHYVIKDGLFDQAYEGLEVKSWLPFSYTEVAVPSGKKAQGEKKKRSSSDKVKYTCPSCGAKIWGKQGLRVGCHSEAHEDEKAYLMEMEDLG